MSREGVEWAERFADGLASRDAGYTQLEKACAETYAKHDHLRIEVPSDDMEWQGINAMAEAAHLASAVMNFEREPYQPDLRRHWQNHHEALRL